MGREKALASAGHVHSLNIPEKLIFMQPAGFALTEVDGATMKKILTSQTMSIFSRVCDAKAKDPFNCVLFKCYKFMKGLPTLRYHIQNMSNASELRQAVIEYTSTEIHRDCRVTVRSSGKWFCPMSSKNAGLCLQDLQ